jgi:uncharacterized damage-inducible protein DinB
MSILVDPRFPVGRFDPAAQAGPAERGGHIARIAGLPAALRQALADMRPEEWERRYRDGGWTVRQVVHHLADSHMNAYVRTRLGLTEERPGVTAYDERRWAELPDARAADAASSLAILDGLHTRWARLFAAMTEEQYARVLDHPENGPMRLDLVLRLYAWHGQHHVAHIRLARTRG